MKKIIFLLAIIATIPLIVTSTLSVGAQNSTNSSSQSSPSVTPTVTPEDANSSSASTQAQSETRTQSQTNNPGVGTMTQEQAELRIQEEIEESKPDYTPKNSKALEHQSKVASAAEELIRVAAQIENKGLGDQIRLVAKTQNENQDKIGQSIDKVSQRNKVTKFFIGSNYKELKAAKQTLSENQNQIKELKSLMAQLTTDADKYLIADQIITLQQIQLELKDQIGELAGGFSLFGWMNRWINKY